MNAIGPHLVSLQMGTETGTPLLSILVHPSTVLREYSTVDDKSGSPEGLQRLAYEFLNQFILLR